MRKCKIKVLILIVLLLLLDQLVKMVVKTHMTLEELIPVFGDWFYIRFIENPGAAYGFQLQGDYGKIVLSLFRLVAVGFLSYYINRFVNRKAPTGVIVGAVLILVGALGNIVDSALYGLIFSESTFTTVADFVPMGQGYGTFLHGNVVDMFYFPLIRGVFPQWMPFWGGEPFVFFNAIFNVADAYISVGAIYLILFQHKYFK